MRGTDEFHLFGHKYLEGKRLCAIVDPGTDGAEGERAYEAENVAETLSPFYVYVRLRVDAVYLHGLYGITYLFHF